MIIYLLNSFPMHNPNSFAHAFLCVSHAFLRRSYVFFNSCVWSFLYFKGAPQSCTFLCTYRIKNVKTFSIPMFLLFLGFQREVKKQTRSKQTWQCCMHENRHMTSLPPHHLKMTIQGELLYWGRKGLSIVHVRLAIWCIALDNCGVWIIENLTTTSAW